MSISVIPSGALASVSDFVSHLATGGDIELSDSQASLLFQIMQGFALGCCDVLGVTTAHRDGPTVSFAVFEALQAYNTQLVHRAYPGVKVIRNTEAGQKKPTLERFCRGHYRVPDSQSGYAYLVSAFEQLTYGLPPASGSALTTSLVSMRTLCARALHMYSVDNIGAPSVPAVHTALSNLHDQAKGVSSWKAIPPLFDTLCAPSQAKAGEGRHIFMRIYTSSQLQTPTVMLSGVPNEHQAASGVPYGITDTPKPSGENPVDTLIKASRIASAYLEKLPPDALWVNEGRVCCPREVQGVRAACRRLTSELALHGQQFRCVYDGSMTYQDAMARYLDYSRPGKTIYVVGTINLATPVSEVSHDQLSTRQQALLGLLSQSDVFWMDSECEAQKAALSVAGDIVKFTVSQQDVDVLMPLCGPPIDAVGLKLLNALSGIGGQRQMRGSPSNDNADLAVSVTEALHQQKLGGSVMFIQGLHSAMKRELDGNVDALVLQVYRALPASEKARIEEPLPPTLGTTLNTLERQGKTLSPR